MQTPLKYLIVPILAISLFPSCRKEGGEPLGIAPIQLRVMVSIEDSPIGGGMYHSKNEAVSLFDGSFNRKFVTPVVSTGPAATFGGEAFDSQTYYLLSPYQENATYKSGVVSATVPVEQIPVKDGISHQSLLALGTVSPEGNAVPSTVLKSAVAFVKLPFTSSSEVSRIDFSAIGGETLAGNVELSLNGDIPECGDGENTVSSVALAQTYGTFGEGTYYLCVRPADLSEGYKLSFTLKDGTLKVIRDKSPLSLRRNSVLSISEVDVDAAFEEEKDDTTADPVSSYSRYGVDFKSLVSAGHPRLFLNAGDFKEIKEKVASGNPNDLLVQFHNLVMRQASYCIPDVTPVEYVLDDSGTILEVSRRALWIMFCCSYAYKISGDEAYLAKVREVLSSVCRFRNWNAGSHFLDPSEMALGVAVAYDWLYDELTLEERKLAHEKLIEYELNPYIRKQESTDDKISESNNWNQVCNGGALAAAIVLYEKDKVFCFRAIDYAIKSNKAAVRKMFDPNGSGTEGPGYWNLAMGYQMAIIQALDAAFGTNCDIEKTEGLRKTGKWYLFMDGVAGPFGFSDSSSDVIDPSPMLFCLSAKYDQPENLVGELHRGIEYYSHRILPLCVAALHKYPFSHPDTSFPSDKVWAAMPSASAEEKSPVILIRDGWNYDEADRYLGAKAGSGYCNHSHLDGGTFTYDALGLRWATDIPQGKYSEYEKRFEPESFFDRAQTALRWDVLQQNNYFHNTLSFKYSNNPGAKRYVTDHLVGNGSILSAFDGSDGCGGVMDLSPMFKDAAGEVHRTFKLLDGDLYITDEITSLPDHSAPFEWRMVTKAVPEVMDGYIRLSYPEYPEKYMYITVKADGAVETQPAFGAEIGITRPSEWEARDWDSYKKTVYPQYNVVKYSAEAGAGGKASFTTRFSTVKP